MTKPSIHVAIALLFHQGKVLVGWRNAKQHQGNKHEFPGGKVEPNETPQQACQREVMEEVGIHILDWYTFDFVQHDYDDLQVNLHFFHAYVNTAQLDEILQPWTWFHRNTLQDLNFPKANRKIVDRLALPQYLKISEDLNTVMMLSDQSMLYWRVDTPEPLGEFQNNLKDLPTSTLEKIILNIRLWKQLTPDLQQQIGKVHFRQDQLLQTESQHLPKGVTCIGACHDQVSLTHAQKIGLDAVILSPVLATATHPDAIPLGWEQFELYAKNMDIPVYALGGLSPQDLDIAQQNSGYGVAGISNF